jgi:K+-sensing histidine kinase KdpD
MELYKEWLPPVEILSRGLAQIKQTIKNKEISFETELQPNLPLVQVDIAHLSQAISNLTLSIIGAGKRYLIKAKEKTGMPDLDPKRKYLEITITALEPNSLNKTQKGILKNFGNLNLSLSIANPEFGLGLYIARNIIELHNGKVILKEEPKDNLLWHVYLPITN